LRTNPAHGGVGTKAAYALAAIRARLSEHGATLIEFSIAIIVNPVALFGARNACSRVADDFLNKLLMLLNRVIRAIGKPALRLRHSGGVEDEGCDTPDAAIWPDQWAT
jgi:hypothetical protein